MKNNYPKNNVVLNLIWNLSAFLRMRSGFTLIELLVVVLIIGILASIAVPQYQKAVDRAEATEAVTQGRALVDAQVRYYMVNQTTTLNLENLDIEIPSQWDCRSHCNRRMQSSQALFEVSRYSPDSIDLWCLAGAGKTRAKKVCEKLGPWFRNNQSTDYYRVYRGYLY